MTSGIKKPGDLITGGNALKSLMHKAAHLKALHKHFIQYLPPNCRNLCHVANCAEGRLVVIAANGSIATQIRFANMDLLRQFKDDPLLKHIRHIEAKVRPGPIHQPLALKSKPMAPISRESAELINRIAESISDPRLKETLQKIATYTKKS